MKKSILSISISTAILLAGCSVNLEPLTHQERSEYIQKDIELQKKFNYAVTGPISIYDAMARTVVANIDHQIQVMEQSLALGEFEKAKLAMLPELRALGAITHRDPQAASKSINVDTNEVSTGGYTSSEEKTHTLGDITFSWNLLDFGLSYYQAKQQADAVLVRSEMQRNVMQNLLFKVRDAYWKAYFAQEFRPQIQDVLEKSRKALEDAKEVEAKRLMPPLQALQYQKALYEVIAQLESVDSEMNLASIDLRAMMNLPVDAKMELVPPADPNKSSISTAIPKMSDMIEIALDQRPECREAMYRSRASVNDVKKAFVRTLPGIEVRTAFNFDSNTYLRDNEWWNIWGGMTANIMDMITAPKRIDIAKANVNLADYRRLGIHLAVIAQVQMAAKQLDVSMKANKRAQEISSIDDRMFALMNAQTQTAVTSSLDNVRQEMTTVFSRINHYRSYAEAQNSYGRMLTTLGIDAVPYPYKAKSLNELSKLFENQQNINQVDLVSLVNNHKELIKAQAQEESQKNK